MSDLGKEKAQEATQRVEGREATPVSERKLQANRQNALKSTGPRTPRGKAFSRKNAFKHGLFADTRELSLEEGREYNELFNGLYDQYEPVGRAEEAEVERIAACWLRLKRAWRCEKGEIWAALSNVGREVAQDKDCQRLDKEIEAVTLLLQSAHAAIADTGEIPQTVKQSMFAVMPSLESLWSVMEGLIKIRRKEWELSELAQSLHPLARSTYLAERTVNAALDLVKNLGQGARRVTTDVLEHQHALPNREALDKILRYETTIDRGLSRALDRLERLQRRRQREPVPPPLSMCWTQ